MVDRLAAGKAMWVAGLLGCVVACRNTPAAFGPDAATAHIRASELLEAEALSHTRVTRTSVLSTATLKLAHAALVPSRVYGDTSIWTAIQPDSVRVLTAVGHPAGDHYLVAERAGPPQPDRLGDQRHQVTLTRIGSRDYAWATSVELAIGSITPDDVDHVVAATLAATATEPAEALQLGSKAAFPRATAALERLFSLDTVRTTPADDGSAHITLVFGMHPDRLKAVYPAFAGYLTRYTGPTWMQFELVDPAGVGWFDLELGDGRIAVRFRSTGDGHLAPLTGPIRPMPDSLLLRTDFHTRLWLLSLGVSNLVSDFVLQHSEHERGWHLAFRHEPRWHVPLGFLVSGSLRRPFQGEGAQFNVAIRSAVGGQTLLVRGGHIVVEEGTTMRWFGGLGTRAYGDFLGPTEAEEYSFIANVMTALHADLGEGTAAASSGDLAPDSSSRGRP